MNTRGCFDHRFSDDNEYEIALFDMIFLSDRRDVFLFPKINYSLYSLRTIFFLSYVDRVRHSLRQPRFSGMYTFFSAVRMW